MSGTDPVTIATSARIFRMFEMIQVYLGQLINRFRRDEQGAALAEYGLLVALIAVVCIAAITVLGTNISKVFSVIATSIGAV